MNKVLTALLSVAFSFAALAQQSIDLGALWQRYEFYAGGISGLRSMNDGAHYTALGKNSIDKFSYETGELVTTLFDANSTTELEAFSGYTLSDNELTALLETDTESIYRRSSRSEVYVADLITGDVKKLQQEKVRYATFSPDGESIAYVLNNNLFVYQRALDIHIQVTTDGTFNSIINGGTDWVYEEEFALVKAFWWSPDSKYIGFFRFDETNVRSFNMDIYGSELYPNPNTFKYPKAGESNSIVTAHVWNSTNGRVSQVLENVNYEYLPRATWSDDRTWVISTMNRLQNALTLYSVYAPSGVSAKLYHETDDKYLEINDELAFLSDGSFIMLSDRDGWNHLYHINEEGEVKRQITKGDFNVTRFYGIDAMNRLFYQSSEAHVTERNIYSIGLNGRGKKSISAEKGTHNGTFTKDYSLFIDTYSAEGKPTVVTLKQSNGTWVRTLKTNERAEKALTKFTFTPKEFITVSTPTGGDLNAWMIKPVDFDESNTYPMFMFVYGGPGRQTVENSYDGFRSMWFQMLANEHNMIIVSVDNHGTDGRSESFKKSTYGQMGKLETVDQTEAAIELSKRSYVDGNRIGIFGWSYGGYMASNCLFQSPDVFKMAIAVAPVTNWRFYDNIYTERYMGLPADNGDGYDADSPLSHVEGLEGKYLLIHGTGDDNVHVQNSMRMVEALVQADKDFDWFAYPDKNHGIYGGNTTMHLYRMMTEFIANNL